MSARFVVFLALMGTLAPTVAQGPLKVYAAGLAVGADYGITALKAGSPGGADFVNFLLGPAGQQVLVRHGFAPAR